MRLALFVLAAVLPASFSFRPHAQAGQLGRRVARGGSLQAFGEHVEGFQQLVSSMDVLLGHAQSQAASHTLLLADADVGATSSAAAGLYTKVDKTGAIGFLATYIELAIDFGHTTLQALGLKYTYGASIILFTLLVKALTFPLTKTQIESTTRMQALTPMQEKIKARYPNKEDEQTRNQMMSQLFQAAEVNPLAGCLPALAQIPIFISLYRALQNLVAENKLDEPFLWIPDLEGPNYSNPPDYSWVTSAIGGHPSLGASDTLAFLSLPLILLVSQTVSQKVLQPPRDPKKVLTDQEQISQGIINYLPFIVAFFSVNVPAGLAIYWVVNNVMTTLITLATKASIKQAPFPTEVSRMMAIIESGPGKMQPGKRSAGLSSGKAELRTGVIERKPPAKAADGGFSSASAAPLSATAGEGEGADAAAAAAGAGAGAEGSSASAGSSADPDDEDEDEGSSPSEPERKRKKRVKPASKKGKK